MMGQQTRNESLFYYFRLEEQIPDDHLLRLIDRYIDLSFVRERLKRFYSWTGRPSIDPEVLLRLLLVGYLYGITSERRLLEEVRMHLAYRWFTRLDFSQEIPDHSTFFKNRRKQLKGAAQGLTDRPRVLGRTRSDESRSDAKMVSTTDPDAILTTKGCGSAMMAHYDNYLVDTSSRVILGVEATPALFHQETVAAPRMVERVEKLGLQPGNLGADKAYGSGEFLAWLLERGVQPHIPVIDRRHQTGGRFTRDQFRYEPAEKTAAGAGAKHRLKNISERRTWKVKIERKSR